MIANGHQNVETNYNVSLQTSKSKMKLKFNICFSDGQFKPGSELLFQTNGAVSPHQCSCWTLSIISIWNWRERSYRSCEADAAETAHDTGSCMHDNNDVHEVVSHDYNQAEVSIEEVFQDPDHSCWYGESLWVYSNGQSHSDQVFAVCNIHRPVVELNKRSLRVSLDLL